MLVRAKIRFLILTVFFAAIIFSTCEAPMGMGPPIDWEDPVLILDKVSSPLYVRKGTILTGTATDNVGVERIVFTNTVTGEELFPVIRDGDKWVIELLFSSEQNATKIVGEIRAYDKMNNSGERSVAFVTMIIDILPPIVNDVVIRRTDTRIAYLEPLTDLKDLETTDPHGEKKANLYKYQNGWFQISANSNDDETRVEIVSLDFYDTQFIRTRLLSLPVDEGFSNYFPRWTVKEEDLINAGAERFGPDYKTDYYNGGKRYYYRVVVNAIDRSKNGSDDFQLSEEEGFLCLWAKSDEPRGILDPVMGVSRDKAIISRGTPLPVDFFDDDRLEWAYAGLLTEDQWYGRKAIDEGNVTIPQYTEDTAADQNSKKLEWLKDRLRSGKNVYNWAFDKHNPRHEPITEQIEGKKVDEQLMYIPTGREDDDYGQYVLFTLAADNKLPPHDKQGPEWTNTDIWRGRMWNISIIDENAPLIVFDTVKGSPEENTFPPLTGHEFFTIFGYTLRENSSLTNKVTAFRMAWIPFNIQDKPGEAKGADGWIKDVQKALSDNFANMPPGVQYWDFADSQVEGPGKLQDHGNEPIDEMTYRRQSFSKKFSVLGREDDLKPETRNFTYKDELENETKLFIFYALDTMGHEVYRQLRLLGSKTPPDLVIYDVTDSFDNGLFGGLPDPNDPFYNPGGVFDETSYFAALNSANKIKYDELKDANPPETDRAPPFKLYPRGTILKYYIKASETAGIAVDSITMKDITFSQNGTQVGSDYNPAEQHLTFCELYPDVTQRTFLFEATDKLGTVARVQRTIAVTNTARLENITTTTQNGTYGIGQVITLQANFSSQVYVRGGVPSLNIRYWDSGNNAVYAAIPCSNLPDSPANATSILEFNFTVPEGSGGTNITNIIETLYEDGKFSPPSGNKRPIILPNDNVRIIDPTGDQPAFIPGYKSDTVTMPNWTTGKNSLQERKSIRLDGVRPKITTVTVSGKTIAADNTYYFKNGETLEFTLAANESIRASGTPVIQFNRLNSAGTVIGSDTANFKYQRPGASNALVFSLPVSNVAGDGRLDSFSLAPITGTDIVDNADNSVEPSTVNALLSLVTTTPTIYVKKSIPAAPRVTLNGTIYTENPSTPRPVLELNVNPVLSVQVSQSATFPAFEDTIQYSLDGGLKWETYPTANTVDNWTTSTGGNLYISNGEWDLRVRYLDRAGNEGTQTRQRLHVNKDFPKLVGITAVQPNSTYRQGDRLDFNLEFAEPVRTTNTSNVKITLENRATTNPDTGKIDLTATAQTALSTTVTFTWNPLNGKEMLAGLYVSSIKLTGLQDRFGNAGTDSTSATFSATGGTVVFNTYTSQNNLSPGLFVDCIIPAITARDPAIEGVSTDNKTVTLTFSEPVMIGTGKITVRPYGNYKIPAVLENNGKTISGTYVAGFYDIYNNSSLTADDRNTLTKGTSMGNLTLDDRTGQSAGPYIKMTHGLKQGPGFTGNYTGTGANGPPLAGSFMVPDTSTKWVLDYRYSINNASNSNTQWVDTSNNPQNADTAVVPAIRAVLTKAKWRWQEMDLVSSVKIVGNTVTVTLNEQLLDGLQWGLSFPEGAFTDKAGNKAAAVGSYNTDGTVNTTVNSPYWFWSKGVQPPVIRVNRKSYDARTGNWASATGREYRPPAKRDIPGGWGIEDFNTVHYRIESETPDATLTYATFTPANGSITALWTGNIPSSSPTRAWDNPGISANTADNSTGEWVLPNLVRRNNNNPFNQNNPVNTWYEVTENGFTTRRTITPEYQGYRSYNSDATKADLDSSTLTLNSFTGSGGNPTQNSFSYAALQASKNYVVAVASKNGQNSSRSYEGVFRSVVVLNQGSFGGYLNGANRDTNPLMVQGSNVKNGMPSISGFPVYDANETGDNRFLKIFYYNQIGGSSNAMTSGQLYWVSTEIVSQWYFLGAGHRRTDNSGSNGGTHMRSGDVNNYLFSGYGDLTYARNLR